MEEEKKYATSDLYLTAYLKMKGFKFLVEKVKTKASFIFVQSPELVSAVNEYLRAIELRELHKEHQESII